MTVKEFIELTKKTMNNTNMILISENRNSILDILRVKALDVDERDYILHNFLFGTGYLGFMESEVFFEILKNLSRQRVWDKQICRKFYEYLSAYGWRYEAYIVMRLILLEKIITISKFCEGYDFYIDGIPQFLDEPVWGNIDFRADFDNDFE